MNFSCSQVIDKYFKKSCSLSFGYGEMKKFV